MPFYVDLSKKQFYGWMDGLVKTRSSILLFLVGVVIIFSKKLVSANFNKSSACLFWSLFVTLFSPPSPPRVTHFSKRMDICSNGMGNILRKFLCYPVNPNKLCVGNFTTQYIIYSIIAPMEVIFYVFPWVFMGKGGWTQ